MHGTADDFVKYSGIHAFLNTKIAEYGCPTTPVTTKPYPASKADSKSYKEFWGPCTNSEGKKSEITLISIAGMIHDWATAGKANANTDPEFAGKPFDIDGSEEAWAFLKARSLTGADSGSAAGGNGAGTDESDTSSDSSGCSFNAGRTSGSPGGLVGPVLGLGVLLRYRAKRRQRG